MLVLTLVGEMGSGKGTVAAYLHKRYGAKTYRFSSILSAIATCLALPLSRDTLIRLSEVLRGAFGEDLLAHAMTEEIRRETPPLAVVDGARRMADVIYLKELPGFHLVHINASLETRFKRIKNRGEKPEEKNLTFEQFVSDHERSTEQSIRELAALATETITNDGTRDKLHEQVDVLMERLKSHNS